MQPVATRQRERGASLVEFAVVLPLFTMLVLGMFSGGVAYSQKSSITAAAREGARYGATLPKDQFPTAAAWLDAVRATVVERANGDASGPGTSVCVALVSGTASPPAVTGGYSTTGSACYGDSAADPAERVQVVVRRQGTIEALVFTSVVDLSSTATARFES